MAGNAAVSATDLEAQYNSRTASLPCMRHAKRRLETAMDDSNPYNPVYTIQPTVKPVEQPVGQPVGCLFTRCSRLFKRFHNRLYRVNGVLVGTGDGARRAVDHPQFRLSGPQCNWSSNNWSTGLCLIFLTCENVINADSKGSLL